MNSRAQISRILGKWLKTRTFPDALVEHVTVDRAFVVEVVYGAVKRRRTLEWVMARYTHGKPSREAVPFLLTGMYQLLFMDGMEPYAAVNETVAACSCDIGEKAAGFVNAILRKVSQEKQVILEDLRKESLGIRESHPDIMVDRWRSRFGDSKTEQLCAWNNTRPPVVLRVNRLKTSVPGLIRQMEMAGIKAEPHCFAPEMCIALPHGVAVMDVPGYRDGHFMVQDPSTITAVELLAPMPGERVLDACAAPGGKTVLMAELMFGKAETAPVGRLVAMDSHNDRLELLRDNMARMNCPQVEVVVGDAMRAETALGDSVFDAVLIDAPCTNTGVLRRRADARWRFSTDRFKELCATQRGILGGVSRLVRAGGRIVYATCSLEKEEGDGLVREWLKANEGFELKASRSLFPPDSQTDGMYACLLVKRDE